MAISSTEQLIDSLSLFHDRREFQNHALKNQYVCLLYALLLLYISISKSNVHYMQCTSLKLKENVQICGTLNSC